MFKISGPFSQQASDQKAAVMKQGPRIMERLAQRIEQNGRTVSFSIVAPCERSSCWIVFRPLDRRPLMLERKPQEHRCHLRRPTSVNPLGILGAREAQGFGSVDDRGGDEAKRDQGDPQEGVVHGLSEARTVSIPAVNLKVAEQGIDTRLRKGCVIDSAV
jgi:hypothetical protein